MFNFSGCSFSGCTFSEDMTTEKTVNFGTPKMQKFDNRKSEDGTRIEELVINSSFIDVNISTSNSSKIEVYFYGQANIAGNINFDVKVMDHELKITLQPFGTCFENNLKLDVVVPQKIFKAILVNTSFANITLNKGVSTNSLEVRTQSGTLKTSATFTNLFVSTTNGNVDFYINAIKDIFVNISTIEGDVWTEFENIRYINLSTNSIDGNLSNCHTGRTGYTANVTISTIGGNINIR